MNDKWILRFVDLAKYFSNWSKDPSTKVGAVIVDEERKVVGTGYNGLPRRISNEEEILNNRERKYEHIIHGEINAILNSNKSCKGCVLFTWPFLPCSRCASIIIQNGIKSVIAPYTDNERWVKSINMGKQMFSEAGVIVKEVVGDSIVTTYHVRNYEKT